MVTAEQHSVARDSNAATDFDPATGRCGRFVLDEDGKIVGCDRNAGPRR